jgi:hypothetical protein
MTVSIPKRRISLPLFLFCANFKIFTHLLPKYFINFNDRVRKVPKMYYLNVWNVSDPIVEVNTVVRHKPAELHALCIISIYILGRHMQFDVNIRLHEY